MVGPDQLGNRSSGTLRIAGLTPRRLIEGGTTAADGFGIGGVGRIAFADRMRRQEIRPEGTRRDGRHLDAERRDLQRKGRRHAL